MVLVVPVLSFFFVWPLAKAVSDPSCTYECDSSTLLGGLVLAGELAGIVLASVATWAWPRRIGSH